MFVLSPPFLPSSHLPPPPAVPFPARSLPLFPTTVPENHLPARAQCGEEANRSAPNQHENQTKTRSLAGGGWERVRTVVLASSHDLKKAVYLCASNVLAAQAARAGRGGGGCGRHANDAQGCLKPGGHGLGMGQDPSGGGVCCGGGGGGRDEGGGGVDAGESRCVLVTNQGVLLQVCEERVVEVMSELRSAVAAVEWWPEEAGDGTGAQEALACGSSTSVVGDALVNFVCGYRFGALGQ